MELECCFSDCSVKVKAVKEYRIHLRIMHNLATLGSYKCTVLDCQKKFMEKKSLLDHLYRFHKFPKDIKSELVQIQDKQVKDYQQISDFESQSTISITTNSQPIADINCDNDFNGEEENQENIFDKIFLDFLMDLHANSKLSKDVIKEIFDKMKKNVIDKIFSIAGIDERIQIQIEQAYTKLNSQYKFEKSLKENEFLTSGNTEIISSKIGNVFKKGVSVIDEIKETVCVMPVKDMIFKIFSIPNILNYVLKNIQNIQRTELLLNVINGKKWIKIIENYPKNSIIIPFDLYTDDFETGNALGSSSGAHKIAGYYISFPVFPSHLVLSTKYIFEVMLFETKLKQTDMKPCLEKLVTIFKELESEGLEFFIEGKITKVYFVLTRIVGDNLGLNEILGFTMSFNANKFCRLCKLDKNQTKMNVHPKPEDLRTPEQYEVDIKKEDVSSTGIKEICVFNTLNNFHCTQNYVCDLMHDIYEGVVKYDVSLFLFQFIQDKSIDLDLNALNNIKQNFCYGSIEIGNLSHEITISNSKINLKMSASEAKTFLHFVPLMLGAYISSDNKYYDMLLNLVDISDLIMASYFDKQSLVKLKKLIESYLAKYIKLFGSKLKPKHHFLTHYVECIEYCGPLRFMMTFGYETKNKDVKTYANISNQRKNLPFSLSTKAAMRFNEFIRTHTDGFPKETTHKFSSKIKLDAFKRQYSYSFIDDLVTKENFVYVMRTIHHKKTLYSINRVTRRFS